MLSVKVEREIKQENRVIGPFTLRQTICLLIALAGVVSFIYIVKPDLETAKKYLMTETVSYLWRSKSTPTRSI